MYDLKKASEAKRFFADKIKEIGNSKIAAVTTICATWGYNSKGRFEYMADSEIFICFENGKCLVVTFLFIDELRAEYREMTEEEKKSFDSYSQKDLFNRVTHIHDAYTHVVKSIEKSSLEYGSLCEVIVKPFQEPVYSIWKNGDLIEDVPTTEETFNELEFVMNNGKKFCLRAEYAEDDGYCDFWSDDTIESATMM